MEIKPAAILITCVLMASMLSGCGGSRDTSGAVTTAGTALPETAATAPPQTTASEPMGPMTLSSPEFEDGGLIPEGLTCRGENRSPRLAFAGIPTGTAALALTVVDPDGRDWLHWVVWNIPAGADGLAGGLPAGDLPDGTRQGANDFAPVFQSGDPFPGGAAVKINGWDGPCPPAEHPYVFTLLALAGPIDLPSGTPGAEVLAAIDGSRGRGEVIAEATLTGRFGG